MQFAIDHLVRLRGELLSKTKQPPDHQGFQNMTEMINKRTDESIKDRYIYETLFRKVDEEKKKGGTMIRLQPYSIEVIARYLGYENYADFVLAIENSTSRIVQQCVGVYQSYLRRNTTTGVVLCSPVQIAEENRKVTWLLRGPERSFRGEIDFINNGLFVLMKGESGKQFHHVYNIGQKERPEVLQGIFSGVSTSFEPIGGRVVLVRTNENFESLKPFSSPIADLKKSRLLQDRRIAEYFSDYASNNLSLQRSMTFSLDDLGECK